MKKSTWKKITAGILTGAMLMSLAACGGGGGGDKKADSGDKGDVTTINGAFLGQVDAWPTYESNNNGEAAKHGINVEMKFFDSGAPVIETVPAHEWQVADIGSTPSLMGVLRYDVQIMGVASDEAPANAIVAREDNKVFDTKGANKDFPDIFGTKEQVKGKTFLCTTVSSGHYTLSKYLQALGLKDSDVTIKNLEQAQAIKAFESGEGDFLVLWTPYLYRAFEKGWKEVANGSQVKAYCLMLYLADPEYAKSNPKELASFLAMNNAAQEKYAKDGEKLAPEITTFFTDWAGMKMSDKDVKLDIQTHKIYTVEEQHKLLTSGDLEKMLEDTANFFVNQNKFTKDELKTLKEKHFNINPEFLEEAQKQLSK